MAVLLRLPSRFRGLALLMIQGYGFCRSRRWQFCCQPAELTRNWLEEKLTSLPVVARNSLTGCIASPVKIAGRSAKILPACCRKFEAKKRPVPAAAGTGHFFYCSVAVMIGLVGAFNRNSDIFGLFRGQLGEFDADLFEVQSGNFFIEFL